MSLNHLLATYPTPSLVFVFILSFTISGIVSLKRAAGFAYFLWLVYSFASFVLLIIGIGAGAKSFAEAALVAGVSFIAQAIVLEVCALYTAKQERDAKNVKPPSA